MALLRLVRVAPGVVASSLFVLSSCSAAGAPVTTRLLADFDLGGDDPNAACSLSPGKIRATLAIGGVQRMVDLYIGPEVAQPPSVLFAWHGWGGNAPEMIDRMEPETYWRDAVIVAPHGLPRSFGLSTKPGWQNEAGQLGDRDFALFDGVVAALGKSHCIDSSRVYSTGFSNGAFFTNALACHRAGTLAAAAPRSGAGPDFDETCEGTLPVLVHHGRTDVIVPFRYAQRSLARWAKEAGCTPPETLPARGCVDVQGCEVPLRACTTRGGHGFGRGIVAAEVAEFLRAQSRTP